MPTLQIRNLPEDLYQDLVLRAEQAHRSLAQQALHELSVAAGVSSSSRRQRALQSIKASLSEQGRASLARLPEDLLRQDRER